MLVLGGLAIGLGTLAGSIAVAVYLLIFGVPIALLFRHRLNGRLGVAISIIFAAIASAFAYVRFFDGLYEMSYEALAIVLAFAVPAALLYWRSVLNLLEESELP